MINARIYGAKGDGITDNATAINAGLIAGDVLIDNGKFLIGSSIVFPSNRTVYLKNCELFAKDGTYDNMFRNSDFVNGNTNIKIIGLGNAVINGNAANNNDPEYDFWVQGQAIFTHAGMYRYAKIQFYNVDGFEISGLYNVDRPCYLGNIGKASNGIIKDIFLGVKTIYQNQDGFQLRQGCHDLTISNVYGKTGDDFLSINCLELLQLNPMITGQDVGDIYNISINNTLIGLSNQGGIKIYNSANHKIHDITISGVKVLNAVSALGFGDHSWAVTQPTKDDTYAITVDNLTATVIGGANAVIFDQSCKDVTITNYVNNSGKANYAKTYGTQENISINGTIV
jgi:hypothetical protein